MITRLVMALVLAVAMGGSALAQATPESGGEDRTKPQAAADKPLEVVTPVIISLGALALIAGLVCLRYRIERSKSYLFPVMDTPQRLGANYAAGIGAVLAFHSKLGSPSSQRNQMPDYLTRV